MGNYNFGTRSRVRVVCRHGVHLSLEFLPLACTLFFAVACLVHSLRQGVPPSDIHGIAYKVIAANLSLAWFGYALLASYEMAFCRLHRILLGYIYIAALLHYAERWVGLGVGRHPAFATAAVIGAALFAVTLAKVFKSRTLCTYGQHR